MDGQVLTGTLRRGPWGDWLVDLDGGLTVRLAGAVFSYCVVIDGGKGHPVGRDVDGGYCGFGINARL